MATEKISPFERIALEALKDEQIIVDGQIRTIVDIQFNSRIRTMVIELDNGDILNHHKDDDLEFVMPVERSRKSPNKKA